MTTQEENERICEWLGWRRSEDPGYWAGPDFFCRSTPTFLTWPDVGLMVEALRARGIRIAMAFEDVEVEGFLMLENLTPECLRAAVLKYIQENP